MDTRIEQAIAVFRQAAQDCTTILTDLEARRTAYDAAHQELEPARKRMSEAKAQLDKLITEGIDVPWSGIDHPFRIPSNGWMLGPQQ